jgi:catechol 2,3-dioxygenase-like lactoylglutathione lyase family enzyme
MLLADLDPQPTVAVKDLEKAKAFYGGVLEFQPLGPSTMGVQLYRAGRTVIVVYESQFAGTNQGTAMTWALGELFDPVMTELEGKGVVFEHYQMPNVILDGNVHRTGGAGLAWFKDPDGNIIHLNSFGH